jgi:asparagine synthase (glutamine-hydrolysing)
MCGITGILQLDGSSPSKPILERMTRTLVHRGPDGEGFHIEGPIGLGHRRLSIIDLSSAGTQPICNEDRSIWITYNGEIYNFMQIRSVLQSRGHVFSSHTDSEVIVHAYEEWGVACLQKFNGMFAFGLWDEKKGTLWLVRDRLGVKPLFYCQLPNVFLFGSECKAILAHPQVNRQVDIQALAYFLGLNYTPAPFTLFKQIRQILPGNYLIVERSGKVTQEKYWDIQYQENDYSKNENEYLQEFNQLLEDSIKLRLVSDVPFGAFLSGGIDSSAVSYWMGKNLKEPLKTFTIGFNEPSFDELNYARKVAEVLGAEHHEMMIQANAAEILPKIVWHSEEPTADSSMIAVYYLAQMTRQYVTMVQSGDGADEILAGYETYQAYTLRKLYQSIPKFLRSHVFPPLIHALPSSDAKVSLDARLKRFIKGAEIEEEVAHGAWRMIFDASERQQLLAPIWDNVEAHSDFLDLYRSAFERTNAKNPLNRMLYVDTRFYLPNDMLVKMDRMSMAHGLEAREPYLDYRLVEFAATLPPNLKLKNLRHKKYLLKKSMDGRLPKEIIWRKKAGLNLPNARWIKGELKPFVMDTLSDSAVNQMGFLDPAAVGLILNNHFSGKAENSHKIWCLLTLALWWQQFIKGHIENE